MSVKRTKLYLKEFDTPLAYAKYLEELAGEYSYTSKKDRDELAFGSNKTIDTFADYLEKIIQVNSKWKNTYDVYGSKIDMSRALTGNPKSFVLLKKRNQKTLDFNICVDMTIAHYYSNGEIENIGKKVVAIIERLNLEGNRIGLYCATSFCKQSKSEAMLSLVNLKNVNEPLELSKIVYACSNPNFLRRCGFDFHNIEANKRGIRTYSGYGTAIGYQFSQTELSIAVSRYLKKRVVYLPFNILSGRDLNEIYEIILEGNNLLDGVLEN